MYIYIYICDVYIHILRMYTYTHVHSCLQIAAYMIPCFHGTAVGEKLATRAYNVCGKGNLAQALRRDFSISLFPDRNYSATLAT